MAWGQLQIVGKHTLADQIRLCVRCLRVCTWISVPRTSVTDVLCKQLFQLSNKLFVVHQPTLCALWVRLRHLEKLPTDEHVWTGIITCGGLEEEVDCGVCGGALTLPFIDFPSRGTSSELEAGKAGNSLTLGSEEARSPRLHHLCNTQAPAHCKRNRRNANVKWVCLARPPLQSKGGHITPNLIVR